MYTLRIFCLPAKYILAYQDSNLNNLLFKCFILGIVFNAPAILRFPFVIPIAPLKRHISYPKLLSV